MAQPLILFYDANKGETVFGQFIDDEKGLSAIVLDQDILDLMRWDSESPNVEPNPYENLREVNEGKKIWLRSGRVLRRRRNRKIKWNAAPMKIELVEDDGIRQRFRTRKEVY